MQEEDVEEKIEGEGPEVEEGGEEPPVLNRNNNRHVSETIVFSNKNMCTQRRLL